MNRNNAWAWSLMLLATLLFGIGLGLSLGYAFFAPQGTAPIEQAAAPSDAAEPPISQPASQPPPKSKPDPSKPSPSAPATGAPKDAYWAARHLFVTVNGQWLADAAGQMLAELRPGAVLLTESNLGGRAQTFALVREIKKTVGVGDGLGDVPLIAVQQEGGPYNQLAVDNAPSAQAIGQSGDPELARKIGREYAEACVGRGIAVAFAPVLDVFEVGAINPGYAARSFGSDQVAVTTLGLAMADGLRQGGVLPVVKHFPGFGAATYGADGMLVVLNKDYGGLARVMYPFNEAAVHGVPGMLVAHVAVPALDPENPRRSAALSPVLVTDLLRNRWGFEGVVIADDVAFNSMTRDMGAEAATVQALAAGCDAVLVLDPDPSRIRSIALAISGAVLDGTLSREKLEQSVARLERWQEAIGNLNPLAPEPEAATVAEAIPAEPIAVPANVIEQAATSPEPIATPPAEPQPIANPLAQSPPPAAEEKSDAAPVEKVAAATPDPPVEAPQITTTDASRESAPKAETPAAESNTAPAESAPIAVEVAAAPETTLAESGAAPAEAKPATSAPEAPAPPEALPAASEPEVSAAESKPVPADPKPAEGPQPSDPAPAPEPAKAETKIAKVDTAVNQTPPPPKDGPAPAAQTEVNPTTTPDESNRSSIVHSVKQGEHLSGIADVYGVSVTDLVRWNSLDSAQVKAGAELTVYLPELTGAPTDPVPTTLPPKTEPVPPAEADVLQDVVVPSGKLVHTVVAGDTLSSISEKYQVGMADITLWNGLEEAALKPGQLLTIFLDAEPAGAPDPGTPDDKPEAQPATAATADATAPGGPPRAAHYAPKTNTAQYVVKPGDTLMKIGREFNTSTDALMKLNDLKNANQIIVGQKLKVPAPN